MTGNHWLRLDEQLGAGQRLVLSGAFLADLAEDLTSATDGQIWIGLPSSTWSNTAVASVSDASMWLGGVYIALTYHASGSNPYGLFVRKGTNQLHAPFESVDELSSLGGAFIELEEGLDGMIHVSDISWTRKINHPSEVLKKGDEVEAVVLEIDKANQRISVGVKQLSEDPWENIDQFYKVGDLVNGSVTKLASFGAFIGLEHDIDGLVHISQVSEERVEKIKNVLKVGQEVTARVIKIDRADRRIGLSIKAANYSTEELEAEQVALDQLKPGEDLVALQHAFDAVTTTDEAGAEKEE